MHYHRNAKTNIEQRQIIKESSESTRDLANRFIVSHVAVAKWRKTEHLEDKSSKPNIFIILFLKQNVGLLLKLEKEILLFSG